MVAMKRRLAEIDATGKVVNVIVWDGDPEWYPASNKAIECPASIGPGWTYSLGGWERVLTEDNSGLTAEQNLATPFEIPETPLVPPRPEPVARD
jgi:hypothetical protein